MVRRASSTWEVSFPPTTPRRPDSDLPSPPCGPPPWIGSFQPIPVLPSRTGHRFLVRLTRPYPPPRSHSGHPRLAVRPRKDARESWGSPASDYLSRKLGVILWVTGTPVAAARVLFESESRDATVPSFRIHGVQISGVDVALLERASGAFGSIAGKTRSRMSSITVASSPPTRTLVPRRRGRRRRRSRTRGPSRRWCRSPRRRTALLRPVRGGVRAIAACE